MRGRDCWFTRKELDPGSWKLLTPAPVIGIYVLPTFLTGAASFKAAAMREYCVVETSVQSP